MHPHSDQRDDRRLRDATEEQQQQQQQQHLLSGDDTMAPETSSSSSSAQQRLEEKRREAEAQSPAAAPASERLGVQVYAALSSSLMTGQSVAAASFGSIAVDHIQRGVGAVDATEGQLTFFLTAHFVGMTLGSLVAGSLGQRFGSRALMLAITPLSLLAWVTIGLAPSVAFMTAGRLVLGFFTVLQMSANVLFISAMSGPKYRGLFCNFMDVFVSLSLAVTFLTGKYMAWRHTALALGVGFNVLAACLLFPLPADPLFLLSRGRLEDARRSLLFYRGPEADMSAIKERAVAAADEARGGPAVPTVGESLRLLRLRSHLVPVLLLVVQIVVYTWSGAGVVINYAVVLIRQVGITMDPFLLSIAMGLGRMPVTVVCCLLVDRWGRRPLLVLSALGMASCHLLMVATFVWPRLAESHWLPAASLFGCMAFFALGLGPLTWVLMGELVPRALRELCGGWLMVLFSLLTVAQLQLFPAMLSALGETGVFTLWACVMLAYVLFVLVALPETCGLDIEQVARLFESPKEGAHQVTRVLPPAPCEV